MNLLEQKLNWKSYTTIKTLLITKWIELIKRKQFAAATFDLNGEIFVVHVAFLVSFAVHPFCRAQIALLIQNKAPTMVPSKYIDFTNIFFPNLRVELSKHTRINNHAINLVEC